MVIRAKCNNHDALEWPQLVVMGAATTGTVPHLPAFDHQYLAVDKRVSDLSPCSFDDATERGS